MNLPTTCMRWRPTTSRHKTKNILIVASRRYLYLFYSLDSDGTLNHWHVTSEKRVHTIKEQDNQIYAVDYREDAERFVTAGKDARVRVYDENTKQRVSTLLGG